MKWVYYPVLLRLFAVLVTKSFNSWNLLGSPVHEISQASVLEWAVISFSKGIFPNQGSNLCLLHWQADSWPLSCQESPIFPVVVVQFLSHVQLFATPWTAARQSSLSFTVPWSLFSLTCIEFVMASNHLNFFSLFSSCPQSFPASGTFPVSRLFTSVGWSIGASASASVLPINIQGWFPLGLAGLIFFLQSRGLSPPPQFESISFPVLSLLYGPTLRSVQTTGKKCSFDYTDICWQSNISAFLIHCLGLTYLFFQGASIF